MNVFGQEGGFEALITRLSPPKRIQLPARELDLQLPAPYASSTPVSSRASTGLPEDRPGESKEGHQANVGGKQAAGSGKDQAAQDGVTLEGVRQAIVAVASVRSLLARRVVRAIVRRTAAAASDALKG